MARPKSKIYYAVAYLRLSREDGDKGESNSITNQKKLIQDYVSKSKDIKLVGEFQDDGFTGTNFNRPGFQNLMEMLEKGKANCVIVKDDCVIIEPTQKDLENQGFVAGSICF